jgi:site-specific recombinase XerD
MLGHSRPSTTQVYTRVLPGMLAAMIEKCHPSRRTTFTAPRWGGLK